MVLLTRPLLSLWGWSCVVSLVFANIQHPKCSSGLFWSPPSNQCVSECPCQYYGESSNRTCSYVDDPLRLFFNQSMYNLSAPINISMGTQLGMVWLKLPLSFFNSSGSGPLELLTNVVIIVDFQGVVYDSLPIAWLDSVTQWYMDLVIAGEVVTGSSTVLIDSLQLTVNDVLSCEEYVILPIGLLAGPGFAGVGINQFSLTIYLLHKETNKIYHPKAELFVDVYSVCSSDQFYLATSGECVLQCPCGTVTYPQLCNEATNQAMMMTPGIRGLEIDPQTPKGALISAYIIYFNVSDGSPLERFNESGVLEISIQSNAVKHSTDEESPVHSSNQFPYYYHFYKPQFAISLPGIENSLLIEEMGPLSVIFPTFNPGVEICSRDGLEFLAIPMEIRLFSPFFYQLGLHWLTINVAITQGTDYWRVVNNLFVNISADCTELTQYDFNSGGCVKECPCGFVGFDYHSPSYCEPAPAEPSNDLEILFPARFSETAYSLSISWDDPPMEEIVPIRVFVYLNMTKVYKEYNELLTANSTLVATIEVLHVRSSPTEAKDVTDGIPALKLSGPALPNQGNGTFFNSTSSQLHLILKNSSQYGLEYCYDEVQGHLVGYIPFEVIVISPHQYPLLANHTFALNMTFSKLSGTKLPFPADISTFVVSVQPGDLGQTPFPMKAEPLLQGTDYYPFIDIDMYHPLEVEKTLDGASDLVGIPVGLPFGDAIHTKAYVGVNGVISFGDKWHFWQPSRFPTSDPWSRGTYIVAPFWSDNDLRISGTVRYATVAKGSHGNDVLKTVSAFIQQNHETALADHFEGVWMLVAHWDNVHPYPHGSLNLSAINGYESYTNRVNSYQALVVTDGVDSYAVFTYNCDQMEWAGLWRYGVVGYNALGDFYNNHPASGFEVVNTSVACANDMYGSPWSNVIYKISGAPDDQLNAKRKCQKMLGEEEKWLQSFGDGVQDLLEPCPCTVWQAQGDFGRFQKGSTNDICYVQRFPLKLNSSEGIAYLTQECCYSEVGNSEFGSLISVGPQAGTFLLFHPILTYGGYVAYDKTPKDVCCNAGLCREFLELRPPQNCSGYVPPTWAWSYGDPHITTLDGRTYTFNGWGDYVMLACAAEDDDDCDFVVQARTTSVIVSGPNPATKLLALAFGIPGELSFQVNILDDGGFYVYTNIDGSLENITNILNDSDQMYNETDGRAEIISTADGSIEAAFSNGAGIAVNGDGGMLSFILSLPSSFAGKTMGLLGNYNNNATDEFRLRGVNDYLSDDLTDQSVHQFGETWAVLTEESLFIVVSGDEGEVVEHQDYQPVFADEFYPSPEQVEVCGGNHQCAYDFAQTGSKEIGLMTKAIQKENAKNSTLLANFPPKFVGESVFHVNVGLMSVYKFVVTDDDHEDRDFLVGVVCDPPVSSALIEKGDGEFEFHLTLQELSELSLMFFAKDSLNASSTLTPQIEICACANGGECTLKGLASTDSTTDIMNCICPSAFDGRFCEEDRNGCLDWVCHEGVECLDLPAPWEGAECGSCPPGWTEDIEEQYKCLDLNECAVNQSICHQECVNEEGGYKCSCWPGFRLDNAGGMCVDVDECLGPNGCQQVCHNSPGSYTCNCTDGFQLAPDEKTCNAIVECFTTSNSSCSYICAVVGSEELCQCHVGYELDEETGSECIDVDECERYAPCDQTCTNLPGSFECSCSPGYKLHDNGLMCTDVNECLKEAVYLLDLCTNNTSCVNLNGSYACSCVPGYSMINGSCQLITELPEVVQVFPSVALDNAVVVVAVGLVPSTFTPDKRQTFRRVTAEVVTDYCLGHTCIPNQLNRERRRVMVIEPKTVALQNITEDGEGRLVFYLYLVLEDGILTLNVLQNALRGQELRYVQSIGNLLRIEFVGIPSLPPSEAASNVPSITADPSELPVSPALGDVVVAVLVILVILLVTIVIAAFAFCLWVNRRKRELVLSKQERDETDEPQRKQQLTKVTEL